MQVVLSLTESLHDLRVHVVLSGPLRRVVQIFPLVGVPVLLALPHERALLRGHFKYIRVEALNHRITDRRLLVDDLLRVSRQLVVEVVTRGEVTSDVGHLFHHCIKSRLVTAFLLKRNAACNLPGWAPDLLITNCCLMSVFGSTGRLASSSALRSAMSASVHA